MLGCRFLLVSLIAWALSTVGCKRETAESIVEPRVVPIAAVVVARQSSFTYSRIYYGRIEPTRRADLSFELPGLLVAVLVDDGGVVSRGQVVAKLDTSALEADRKVLLTKRQIETSLLNRLQRGEREEVIAIARAEVKRMEVDVRLKQAERLRAESVYEGRAISKSAFDDAVYSHESAQFSLEKSRKRLQELETGSRVEDVEAQSSRVAEIDAQLQRLSVQFAKSEMVAPFSAVCIRRHQDEGVTLSPGQIVLEISDVEHLEARFSLPQQDLGQLEATSLIEIENDRYSVKDIRIISEVDEMLRAVDVVIPLSGAEGNRVLPGQTCTLRIKKCVAVDCLQLPVTALVPSVRGLWSCYRLQPHADDQSVYTVEKVEVSIIHTDGQRVVVTAALNNSDLVIPSGVHKVVPGMTVRIVDEET